MALLLLALINQPALAQKQLPLYEPNALYDRGLVLFNNGEYGAALETFTNYLGLVEDKKLQNAVNA